MFKSQARYIDDNYDRKHGGAVDTSINFRRRASIKNGLTLINQQRNEISGHQANIAINSWFENVRVVLSALIYYVLTQRKGHVEKGKDLLVEFCRRFKFKLITLLIKLFKFCRVVGSGEFPITGWASWYFCVKLSKWQGWQGGRRRGRVLLPMSPPLPTREWGDQGGQHHQHHHHHYCHHMSPVHQQEWGDQGGSQYFSRLQP